MPMILPKAVDLVYAPANATKLASQGLIAAARIVELTDGIVAQAMGDAWWADKRLNRSVAAGEIDRHWDWYARSTDYLGRDLAIDRFAILTDDGAVQGAMSVTVDGVLMDSPIEPGRSGLFVERLFTAPRNRPGVIANPDQPIYFGVGSRLLRLAVELSRERGFGGRIKLDGSPGALSWYVNRGLRPIPGGRTVFEGVEYVSMELSAAAADALT